MPKERLIPPSVPAPAIADKESMLNFSDLDDLEWNESDLAVISEIEESEKDLFWLKDAEAILSLTGIEAKDINSERLLNPDTLRPICLDDSSGFDAARLPHHEAIKLSALGELVVSIRSGEPIKSDTGAFIFGKENKSIFLTTHPEWSEPLALQKNRQNYRVMDRRTRKAFTTPDGQIYYSVSDAKAAFPDDASFLVSTWALSHSRVMDKRTGKVFADSDGRIYYSVPEAKAAFPDDASYLVTGVALYKNSVMDKRTGKPFAASDGRIHYSVPEAKAAFPDDAPYLVTPVTLSKSRVMDKRTGKVFAGPDDQIYYSVPDAKTAFPDDASFLVTAEDLYKSRVMDKRTGKVCAAYDGSKTREKKCKPSDPSGSFSLTAQVTHTDDAPDPVVPAVLSSSTSKKRPPPVKNPLSASTDAFFASSREDSASSMLKESGDSKRWKPNTASM